MKFELTIPSSLSEISLKQYKKFLKIQESNEDSYFLQCKMIEISQGLSDSNGGNDIWVTYVFICRSYGKKK